MIQRSPGPNDEVDLNRPNPSMPATGAQAVGGSDDPILP